MRIIIFVALLIFAAQALSIGSNYRSDELEVAQSLGGISANIREKILDRYMNAIQKETESIMSQMTEEERANFDFWGFGKKLIGGILPVVGDALK